MALVATAPGLPPRLASSYSTEGEDMSTIPDPRSRTMSPAPEGTTPTMHHPDLNDEVATLSTKLINAINYQTNLDDTLSATRCELDSSRDRLRQLEAKVKIHEDQVSQGVLVEKSIADEELAKAVAELKEEKSRRMEVEKAKKEIELELETLTTALFEEANNMVTSAREEARKELDVANRRNEQLKTQVADTEALLRSHQEQLAQLKMVMEQMSDDRTNSTAPPTPGLSKVDSKEHFGVDSLENLAINEELPPSYPTSFTHLLHPVLRTDLASYDEFISLVRLAKATSAPGSRISSGSYGSLGIGLGLYTKHPSSTQVPSTASASSTSTGTSPVTPNTPFSATSAASIPTSSSTPLNDTKFYKRALSEDIEPCLRLDTAPGISWMARRSMLKSMCEGSLVVEPMPASTKKFSLNFSCSLCGENRSGDEFVRSHRFRISENANAQRYPLCRYCLGRIRSSCDFVGFLRMLKDGHWRAEGEEAEKAAWEESVRLREQMFWCRMGGGVRPGPIPLNKEDKLSPRTSEDDRREQEAKISEEFQRTGAIQPKDVTPVIDAAHIFEAGSHNASPSRQSVSTISSESRRPSTSTASIRSTASSRRPSTPSQSRRPSVSSVTRRPSTPVVNRAPSTSSLTRSPSTPSVTSVPSTSSVTRVPSASSVTRKPLPSAETTQPSSPEAPKPTVEIKRPSTMETKRPSVIESRRPSTMEAMTTPVRDLRRPSVDTKRPSTASSEKASKVSNIRMMFEKKKDTAEGLWQAAQDDAAAPPSSIERKKRTTTPPPATSTEKSSDSSESTINANTSSPGDSTQEQQLPDAST